MVRLLSLSIIIGLNFIFQSAFCQNNSDPVQLFRIPSSALISKYQELTQSTQISNLKSNKIYLDSTKFSYPQSNDYDYQIYEYNKNFNRLSYFEKGINEKKTSYVTVEFDNNGVILKENRYASISGRPTFLSRITNYEYQDTIFSKITDVFMSEAGDTTFVDQIRPYYSQGKLMFDTTFNGSTIDDLQARSTTTYSYNQKNQIAQIDFKYVNEENIYRRETFEYGENELIQTEKEFFYSPSQQALVLSRKRTYGYNSKNLLEFIERTEESSGFIEITAYKYVDGFLKYIEVGNGLTPEEYSVKMFADFTITNSVEKDRTIFEEDYYFDKRLNPGVIRKALTYYDGTGSGDFTLDSEKEFYWSDITSGVKEYYLEPKQVLVSPNPTDGEISFNTERTLLSFEIFSMDGKLKMTGTTGPSHKIDISNFPPGIYTFQLKSANYNGFGRFVKK